MCTGFFLYAHYDWYIEYSRGLFDRKEQKGTHNLEYIYANLMFMYEILLYNGNTWSFLKYLYLFSLLDVKYIGG